MSGSNGAVSSREETLRAIREHERFCLTTHEGPDGDAVGSLAAMMKGGRGADRLRGGRGIDRCRGGQGHDSIRGCER